MPSVLFRSVSIALASVLLFSLSPVAKADTTVKIGVIYDAGGRGDKSFNDAAAQGVDLVRKEFKLGQFSLREVVSLSDTFDKENRIEFLIKAGYNMIICVGPNFATAVKYMAVKYPESQLSIIGDKTVDSINVASIAFNNNEESFLAGAYAAGLSKSGKVGFITASSNSYKDVDINNFRSGARFISPKTKVFAASPEINSNADAQQFISSGVDVIYSTWNANGQVLTQIAEANKSKKNIKYIGISPAQYFLNKDPAIAAIINERFDLAIREIVAPTLVGKTLTDVINERVGVYGELLGLQKTQLPYGAK